MVGSNKILTVSYGTFSCTLEGFEDSFGTMKAIAEYFRDLTADDRYFGAEPPVPDVQMLALIAEREVARRVEARIDASGITLRTGEALPPRMAAAMQAVTPLSETTLPVATAAAEGDVVGPEAEVIGDDTSMLLAASDPTIDLVLDPVIETAADIPEAAEPLMPPAAIAPRQPIPLRPIPARPIKVGVTPVAATLPEPVMPPAVIPAHPDADSVAAKLQRIRAVVGRGTMPLVTPDFAEDLADGTPFAVPVTPGADLSSAWAKTDDADADARPTDGLHDDQPADTAFDMDVVTAAVAAEEPAAEASATVAPTAPVRARVIRMRPAAFDKSRDDADIAPAIVIETAADLHELDRSDDPDAIAELETLDMDGAKEPGDAAFAALFDDGGNDPTADVEVDFAFDLTGAAQDDIGSGTLSANDEAELLRELAEVQRETLAALGSEDLSPDELIAAEPDVTDLAADEGWGTDAVAEAMAQTDTDLANAPALPVEAMPDDAPVDDATMDDATMVHAPVVDAPVVDAPAASADIAALFNLPPGDDAVFDFTASVEDPDEAEPDDLPAMDSLLAAVSSAVAKDQGPAEPVLDEAPASLRTGRALLDLEPEADAEAMERILSQTDAELNAPESSRRREAIAQLKAAVAATEAARRLGDLSHAAPEEDEVENAFRDDLKQVVRPRRPLSDAKPEQSRERPRPAPLKLVASQRIDIPAVRPATTPVMPVRPRRVAVEAEPMTLVPEVAKTHRSAGSFAEFADRMGAKALPDLLEAAAAYTSFVEGVEDFSRPQLMKKVQDMAEADFSREDGLRSFGTLLRQGRIMKTRNGRFVVNEETRFNPERRAG